MTRCPFLGRIARPGVSLGGPWTPAALITKSALEPGAVRRDGPRPLADRLDGRVEPDLGPRASPACFEQVGRRARGIDDRVARDPEAAGEPGAEVWARPRASALASSDVGLHAPVGVEDSPCARPRAISSASARDPEGPGAGRLDARGLLAGPARPRGPASAGRGRTGPRSRPSRRRGPSRRRWPPSRSGGRRGRPRRKPVDGPAPGRIAAPTIPAPTIATRPLGWLIRGFPSGTGRRGGGSAWPRRSR